HRVFYARLPLPQHATLLPYTTLFRSHSREHTSRSDRGEFVHRVYVPPIERPGVATFLFSGIKWVNGSHKGSDDTAPNVERHAARSEEHTSELQSRFDLVCRLLPHKKN